MGESEVYTEQRGACKGKVFVAGATGAVGRRLVPIWCERAIE